MQISNNLILIFILFLIGLSTFNTLVIFQKKGIITSFATSQTATVGLTILPPENVRAPFNLTATLNIDNVSVNINWSNISEADSYNVYYSSNITAIKRLNLSNIPGDVTVVTGITSTNWTDSTASNVIYRYYTVSSVRGLTENISKENVGKFRIEVLTATMNPGEVEINIISLPLIPEKCDIKSIVPFASEFDTIAWYNPAKTPPSFDNAYYISGDWYGDFTCLEPGKGYQFSPITQGYNITLTGKVPEGNITTEIMAATMNPGEVEINTVGWNSVYTNCNLSGLLPQSSEFDTISWYNAAKTPPSFDSAYYVSGDWYGDFACLEPGKGYQFSPISQSYNWTYNRSVE